MADQCPDAFLEPSDEEILGYSSESEDEAPRKKAAADVSDEEEVEQEEEDVEGWGASKKDYYNHDEILTEADALEEEKEARRLQQKRLAKMSDADFRIDDFDEDEWVASAKNDEDDGDVVIEVLKDVEITPDMNPEERMRYVWRLSFLILKVVRGAREACLWRV
jgi:U3 small nucleolar RNA-associated protein 3